MGRGPATSTNAWHGAAAFGRRALLALVVAACGTGGRSPSTVVVASGADLESANPLTTVHPLARQVQRYALFVTLARYDSLLAPEPYFARSWTWSADHRTLTLALARDLRWHDGTPTTATDVAFTIDAARDPATGFFRRGDLAEISGVAVHNDTSVSVTFAGPQARFPLVLCELPIAPAHRLSMVPRAQLRADAFARDPIGNGPYRFVERRARQFWTFVADTGFPASMGGPPKVRRFVVAVVDEPTTKFAGLVSGDLDLAGISPTMAEITAADPRLAIVSYPVSFTNVIVFNSTRAPFDDVRVRRAVSAAINRKRVIDVALNGFGVAADGAIPPTHPYYGAVLPPENAAALLDSAGWTKGGAWRTRNGTPLRFTLRTVGNGDNAIEQLVQADLRALGIQVEIAQMELGAFLAMARAPEKDFDAIITGVPGDVSMSHVAAMFEGTQAGGALDYAGFHRPTLDTLFARARAAGTEAQLAFAWQAVDQLLAREAPVVWLYHARGLQGISRRLGGVRMDLRGELVTLARWTLDR
ncbi:MAG: peptide ABC transporter substrate-binding protein [Cytophagaceae bacterium]|nr:peptide ABC transporter substrate-binding protein [Gemmatimonadaceae bacterium]